MGEGSTSEAATGSAATTDGGGATSDPATSAAGTMGGSGSSGAEADTGPETSSTSMPGSDSGSSEGTDETGDPPAGPYGPCGPDEACAEGSCFMEGDHDMCLPDCGADLACRLPDDATAVAECIAPVGMRCMLNCAGGASCPGGTDCVEIPIGGGNSVYRCLWPA